MASQARRLATPAWARIFWSRSRPWDALPLRGFPVGFRGPAVRGAPAVLRTLGFAAAALGLALLRPSPSPGAPAVRGAPMVLRTPGFAAAALGLALLRASPSPGAPAVRGAPMVLRTLGFATEALGLALLRPSPSPGAPAALGRRDAELAAGLRGPAGFVPRVERAPPSLETGLFSARFGAGRTDLAMLAPLASLDAKEQG